MVEMEEYFESYSDLQVSFHNLFQVIFLLNINHNVHKIFALSHV